jgi:hypothetical protein
MPGEPAYRRPTVECARLSACGRQNHRIRPVLLALAALAAFALLAWSIPLAVDAVDALSETRIGDTRTAVPGSHEVELEARKHTVFYEVEEGGSIDVPPLEVAIRPEGDRPPLALEDFSGNFDLTSGGRQATAIATVRVPEEGRYRIGVTGRAGDDEPAVVLGRPVLPRILRLLGALAAIVAGLGLAALAAAIAIAIALRASRASA